MIGGEQRNKENSGTNSGRVPRDISQIFTIAKYELLNYRRSKRFLGLLVIIFGAGLAASVVVGYYRPPSMMSNAASFLTHWLEYTVVVVIALPASFLGGDAISSEFQSRTGYSMIGNPLRRYSLFLGKVIAALAASEFMLVVFEALLLGNAVFYFGVYSISFQFWESFLFSAIAIAGATGLAFFFSSLIKSSAISVLFSTFLLLYGFNLLENVLGRLTNIEPWFLLNYGAQIIMNIFIVPYPVHMMASQERMTYFATVTEGIAIMVGYFIVGLVVSLMIFRRREFT